MARKSNTEILKNYRDRLEQSVRWRKEEQYDDCWRRMIDLYRGKHYHSYSEADRLLVNMAFATINVIWPGVSVNYPKIVVSARTSDKAPQAVMAESIVNYWWRRYDCQEHFREATKDYLLVGHGWLKTGYRFVEKDKTDVEDSDEMATDAPESMAETEIIITEDRPFIERISPFDMFVDPDATSMNNIRWIAQRIRRPLKAVKKDKRYNAQARNQAAPSHYSKWSADEHKRPRRGNSAEDAYVEIWEFYDLDTNKMSIFCEGSTQFLVPPTDIPFAFGHPYVFMANYKVPDQFYPIGDLEAIEPLQLELNETRTQIMNHRKRFSRKWLYKESAFDSEGRNALESDEDNVLVPVVSEESLGSVITPMPAIVNPPELYNLSDLITNDINKVSGVTEYQRGTIPETRRTATEAGILADAANARVSDKLAQIEKTIGELGKRLIALAQQYLTGEHSVRVLGGGSQQQAWLTFDSDYISGEFDFEVVGGSTQPLNESFRRQTAIQLVDAMAPFVQMGVVDPGKLVMYILEYGFGIKDPSMFVAPPPPPEGPPGPPEPPMGGPPPVEGPPGAGPLPPELMAMLMGGGGAPPQGMPQLPPEMMQGMM